MMRLAIKPVLTGLVVLVALLIAAIPPAILADDQARVLGIVLVTLVLWATGIVPGYLASLIFFSVLLIFGLAGPELVFIGFESAAIWLIVSGFVTITGLFSTTPGVPAVLTPMAGDLAAQSGLSLHAVLMSQVVGFSTVIFPYQVGPLVVAMQLSGERLGHLLKITIPLALVTLVLLLPLDFLWWKLLALL